MKPIILSGAPLPEGREKNTLQFPDTTGPEFDVHDGLGTRREHITYNLGE